MSKWPPFSKMASMVLSYSSEISLTYFQTLHTSMHLKFMFGLSLIFDIQILSGSLANIDSHKSRQQPPSGSNVIIFSPYCTISYAIHRIILQYMKI